ncbi:unnamed protein product [Pleuronectes platessa]|uniref:CCHC-type domain-containing protein n=1 Tax=Pleuronectes platessa TaxID=8262 RepID=A0A9N7VUJ9_PLEPL|nr:unnamed protein product [Pleuronectes platessa]
MGALFGGFEPLPTEMLTVKPVVKPVELTGLPGGAGRHRGVCFECGEEGHTVRACPRRSDPAPPGPDKATSAGAPLVLRLGSGSPSLRYRRSSRGPAPALVAASGPGRAGSLRFGPCVLPHRNRNTATRRSQAPPLLT